MPKIVALMVIDTTFPYKRCHNFVSLQYVHNLIILIFFGLALKTFKKYGGLGPPEPTELE